MLQERYFSISEVARITGDSYGTIRNHILSGDIPASKPNGKWKIGYSDLAEYVSRNKYQVKET